MSGRLRPAGRVAPRVRILDHGDGYFYTAEVGAILGLEGIDYAQMRRLLKIVRYQSGATLNDRAWARYSLADVAALDVLVELAGGRAALTPGRRLQLRGVAEACSALNVMGFENPLVQVPMVRSGGKVLASIEGLWVDPTSGQSVLDGALDAVDHYLRQRSERADELIARLRSEASELGLTESRRIESR